MLKYITWYTYILGALLGGLFCDASYISSAILCCPVDGVYVSDEATLVAWIVSIFSEK
jgi:hypothetical protein